MTEPKQRRKPRKYTDEFKRKYVIIRICQQLYFSDTLFS